MSEGFIGRKPQPDPDRPETHYTQVNIMFPASVVELPSADRYNAFPPEAQKAILEGFKREQAERHAWLKTQQHNEHVLNLNAQRHTFVSQNLGTICGTLIVLSLIGLGAMLVHMGVPAAGGALIVTAIGGVIGVAVYGHRETVKTAAPKEPAVPTEKLPGPTGGKK